MWLGHKVDDKGSIFSSMCSVERASGGIWGFCFGAAIKTVEDNGKHVLREYCLTKKTVNSYSHGRLEAEALSHLQWDVGMAEVRQEVQSFSMRERSAVAVGDEQSRHIQKVDSEVFLDKWTTTVWALSRDISEKCDNVKATVNFSKFP